MMEVQKLTLTTADDHRFEAAYFPTDDPLAPILLFLSALGTPARVYGRFGREMVLNGVQVCTPDWRGIASSSVRAGRRSDFGYRHLLEFDLTSLIEAVRQRFPNSPLWLGGHSLGGQLALLKAAAIPQGISGVVLVASGSVHLAAYQGKLHAAIRCLAYLSGWVGAAIGYFPGARVGFGGREAAGLMRDWSEVARTGQYRPAESKINYEQCLRSLEIPVLALTFEADAWSPASAAQALLKKLSAQSPLHWHWATADTGGTPVDHYSWLKQPSLVAPALAQFMSRVASREAG